jgi:hypothetical protein
MLTDYGYSRGFRDFPLSGLDFRGLVSIHKLAELGKPVWFWDCPTSGPIGNGSFE